MVILAAPGGGAIHWAEAVGARVSLLCLPYAGGDGAAFRQWPARLGHRARVGWAELPGRGCHFRHPPLRRIADQVQWLVAAVRAVPPPLVLFGYSMGALIAFELVHTLREAGAPQPALLLVAAHHAPGRPMRDQLLHTLPDDEFVRRLADFEGTPREVLGHAELLALLTPRLRADFEACETYRPPERPPLQLPLVAYGGIDDREVLPSALLHWAALTRGHFEGVLMSGHHFFLHGAADALLQDIERRLAQVA